MASIRITGAKRLPDHVFEGTAKALVTGSKAPSEHAADTGHDCFRTKLEKACAPDSQVRAAVANAHLLSDLDRAMLARAENVAWSQLRKLRSGEDQKARAN